MSFHITRAVQMNAPPAWVPRADGIPADLAIDFTTNQAWSVGSKINASDMLTTTRSLAGVIDSSASVWTSYGTNILRRSDKGALIEEARTNSIRNNSMQGAVGGTPPGTAPTNWSTGATVTGLTRQIVGTGTENGVDYIEIRVSGTPSGAGLFSFYFETSTAIAASNGQTWTHSCFLKLHSGTLTGVTDFRLTIAEQTAAGSFLANSNTSVTPTSSLVRYSATRTFNQATTGTTLPYIDVALTGAAIDFTVRIGWPQMEQGSWASSPIRTTSAAVTRPADVVTYTFPTVLQGTGAYSLFGIGTPLAPTSYGTNQQLFMLSDTTDNNRTGITRLLTSASYTNVTTGGGSSVTVPAGGTWAQNTRAKLASAVVSGDETIYANGSVIGSPTSNAVSYNASLQRLNVGANGSANAAFFNGYIEVLAVWKQRIANAQLARLTA